MTSRAIDHRVGCDRLHRIHRGVYLVGHQVPPPYARELAAALACGPGALVSHRSAAALWSLPTSDQQEVDVTASRGRTPRPGIRLHRVLDLAPRHRTVRLGVPVTTPIRTLFDLAQIVEARELERAYEEAWVKRLVNARRLAVELERSPGRRGAAALRKLLEREAEPTLTRREAEIRLRELVRSAELPVPETNVRVGRYEVDVLWRAERLVVEVDSWRWHSSRAAFERDRRRDADLVARGLRVIRVTWRQIVYEPIALATRLGVALDQARREG